MINFKPLHVANCQFKIIRENSLLSKRERETHARTIKENTKGGEPQVRRVTAGSITAYGELHPRPIPIPVPNPNPILPPIIRAYETKPPVEVDRKPNCDLIREMS